MTKTATHPAAKATPATVVTWPADPNVIPDYIDVPAELEPAAEQARAALMRWREASRVAAAARDALDDAPNHDIAAAADAGPDAMPARTLPQRQAEYDEAMRQQDAAESKYRQAVREQSAAIGPLHEAWLAHHEQQVDARMEKAQQQLADVLVTFSEIETDLNLDRALRAYDPDARNGWWFDWRTSDVLAKTVAKAEQRMRSMHLRRDSVPNEIAELVAALRVHACAWQIERENERKVARVRELHDELEAAGITGLEFDQRMRQAVLDEDLQETPV